MKHYKAKIYSFLLVFTVLAALSPVVVPANAQATKATPAIPDSPAVTPDLSDIIPFAAKLTGRLAALENRLAAGLDTAVIAKRYDGIAAHQAAFETKLKRFEESQKNSYSRLVQFGTVITQENRLWEKIGRPVNQSVEEIGALRGAWLSEKRRWKTWRAAVPDAERLPQIKAAFDKADDTIDTALKNLLERLAVLFALQAKAANIQEHLYTMESVLEGLIAVTRRGALLTEAPPMLSSRYLTQFRSDVLWPAVLGGLNGITWPDSRLYARQGWVLILEGFLTLLIGFSLYRNREALGESERWRFLAARYVSAGLFLSSMLTVLIYEYEGVPATWKLGNTLVAAITFSRLTGRLIASAWQRHLVYGTMIVLVLTRASDVVSLPLPLFRVFSVLTSVIGLLFCLYWSRESARLKEPGLYAWLLKLGALSLAGIAAAEFLGRQVLGLFLFVSLVRTTATAMVFLLFLYLVHGGLEWLFRTPFLQRTAAGQSDATDDLIRRVSRFVDVAIGGLVFLPATLMIWGVYDSLDGAVTGLLSLGFRIGGQRFSVGLLLVSAGILYGSLFVSWLLQKLITDEVLIKRRVERGVRLSMARLLHYAIVLVGFLIAIATLGFEISKITIMLSALGVGIGFGLQGIVNNFVSGLILLFEGPVRVGDTVEIGGKWSEIKRIGLRATTVETVDQADLIIPNSQLVDNQVTNWTLSNRRVRLTVSVGVAYGSDVALVFETLLTCARANSLVMNIPTPQVLFMGFGESTLDFEMRAWILDADYRLKTKSDLNQEIDRRFREANIVIAFPQRDLHVRSLDPEPGVPPAETTPGDKKET